MVCIQKDSVSKKIHARFDLRMRDFFLEEQLLTARFSYNINGYFLRSHSLGFTEAQKQADYISTFSKFCKQEGLHQT